MCVVIGKKIFDKVTKEKNYCLFKIRDRDFEANYEVKTYTYDGVSVLYVQDKDNFWTEGINSNGISLVSAALENYSDIRKGKDEENKKLLQKIEKRSGQILKRALRQKTLDDVIQVLSEAKFTGNTLVSDGNRLFHIDIHLVVEDAFKDYQEQEIEDDMSFSDFKIRILNNLDGAFETNITEIKDDLVVFTNHNDNGGGYKPGDKGYHSSFNRQKITFEVLKNFNGNEFDVIRLLRTLDGEEYHENPEYRPIRSKDRLKLSAEEKEELKISDYFSTDIFGLNPVKKELIILPIHSKIDVDMEEILNKTGIHLVILKDKNENLLFKALKNLGIKI